MGQRGVGPEHFTDALGELSRQLFALGARLMYGGHLGDAGVTKVLFELAARYAPSQVNRASYAPLIVNVVPYPWHAELSYEELIALEADFASVAQLRYMNEDGSRTWSFGERPRNLAQLPAGAWPDALTAMRTYVTGQCDARVVLGGKAKNYSGRMPGIAEEAFITARARKPLFVIGGYGGVARQIADSIASNEPVLLPNDEGSYRVDVPNGLGGHSLRRLATSPHIDEVAVLLTRGLIKLFADA